MTCYTPTQGYWSKHLNKNGNRTVVFNTNEGYVDRPITIKCGQCIGCRLDKSIEWAVRSTHESSGHDDNCFITLTFDDDHLPENNSLDQKYVELFMKRLRKYVGKPIKFYHCGEYGELNQRPHHHIIVFGYDFPDKILLRKNKDTLLYRSAVLESLWRDPKTKESYGYTSVGSVTFQSAAYVARYATKKISGNRKEMHYLSPPDIITGECVPIRPEYSTQSRGIGESWINEFHRDVYPHDFVVINGRKFKPPKYYDNFLKKFDPDMFEYVKQKRIQNALKHSDDQTPDRMYVKELYKNLQMEKLVRTLK